MVAQEAKVLQVFQGQKVSGEREDLQEDQENR